MCLSSLTGLAPRLNRLSLWAAVWWCLVSAHASPPLTLETAFATPGLLGTSPSAPKWSADSSHVAFIWNPDGEASRHLMLVNADGDGLRRLGAPQSESTRDFVWHPSGETIYSLRAGGLWATNVTSGEGVLIAQIHESASNLSISPDGSRLAWLADGDVWTVTAAGGQPAALTEVGIPSLSSLQAGRYRRAEREIGPGIWGGPTYAWSPDGRTMAVHLVDRRHMRKVAFPNYLAAQTEPNFVRRGYPGDANESRTVALVDVATGEMTALDIPDPTANQVVGFAWSPRGLLLLDLASDTNEDRWLYTLGKERGPLKRIWHSQRASRIYTAFASAWQGERVVFLSDIEDRYGLYRIDTSASDATPTRLTDTDFDVLGAPMFSAADGTMFFAGNGETVHNQHIYRLSATGQASTRVTRRPGRHTGFVSPNGKHLAVVHSDDVNPPDLYVVHVEDGQMRRVTNSPLPAFGEHDWVRARYVSFPGNDPDLRLHARILEPSNLDPSRKYPVIFGPAYSNTVRNRWRGVYSLVQQMLVQRGYIVVQVDMRGSTGYGREFREAFLTDFVGQDLDDVVSAANYIKAMHYVDGERLGIWGSSYGGTLSVYALLKKPGLFKAGVAAAAAVDPHFFGTDDVAIVRRPDTHPEIFERAAVRYAANLEDHLLLIHGMQDQVVPFNTIAVLTEALIREGKNFDTAFVPGATHAWSREPGYNRYLFGRLFDHFDRYLQPDRPVTVRSAGQK